jgi:hypothetical protein
MGGVTDLAERYGTDRPVRRRLVILGVALLAAAGLGWLVWVVLFHGRPLAESTLVSFDVVDPNRAVATVTVVRRSDDVRASCLLRAHASDHSIVGEVSFSVGASRPATATFAQDIRTEREATSVSLLGCSAGGQSRLR